MCFSRPFDQLILGNPYVLSIAKCIMEKTKEKIDCAALKSDEDKQTCIISLGFASGEVSVRKYTPECKNISRSSKKWHFTPVMNIYLDDVSDRVFSNGHEDVIMLWDYSNDKSDFIPRFNDDIKNICVSSTGEFISVLLQNGSVCIKRTENFLTIFEERGLSNKFFSKNCDFNFGSSMGFLNDHLELSILRHCPIKHDFVNVQLNPTERNIITTISNNRSSKLAIDSAVISPDETLFAVSESLMSKAYIVSVRLRIFYIQERQPHFKLMTLIESPHLDEPIEDIHFIWHEVSERKLIRKPDYD